MPIPRDVSHTLQNPNPSDSVAGGWKITNTTFNECTLGFPAIRISNNTNVFVTNSHCTVQGRPGTLPGFDGGTIYQPFSNLAVGTEILDPVTFSCYTAPFPCRHSDAALILASKPLQFGKIARTTERTGFDVTGGALTIYHANPTITISGKWPFVYENEILDKVGMMTGWTYGAVEDTCIDYKSGEEPAEWYKLCSDRVDLADQGGDSGSPVFYWKPDGTAELRGIVFARQGCFIPGTCYNDAIISNMHQIELDLGALSVHAVNAGINGPTLVPENSSQNWTANVSGGKAPFTYTWYRNGAFVSSSSSYTGNTGWSGFQLQLNVSDAMGGSSSSVKDIQVTSCPPPEITC